MAAEAARTQRRAGVPGGGRSLPFDTSVAHQARMYDYVLGGKDNYAADRAAAEAGQELSPTVALGARANRAFLGRAVRYLAGEAGIRQFLDIGTGIPTAGNTHEVAQAIAPESRVVYVDYDPVVLAHARALLTSSEAGATEYIDADLRDTGTILARAAGCSTSPSRWRSRCSRSCTRSRTPTTRTRSWPRDGRRAVRQLPRRLARGLDLRPADARQRPGHRDRWSTSADPSRSREQVGRFFDGLDLVEPGLVRAEEWHPRASRRRRRQVDLVVRWAASLSRPARRPRHRARPRYAGAARCAATLCAGQRSS